MEENVDISYGLWQLISRTRHLLYKIRRKELYKYGVSSPESMILHTILRLGIEATPTAISRETYLEPSSLSGQLARMEKGGLINKIKDAKRKNLVRIEVTNKGYELFLKSKNRKSIKYVMSVLTEEEKLELWRILSKIRVRALKKLGMGTLTPYPPLNPDEMWPSDKMD